MEFPLKHVEYFVEPLPATSHALRPFVPIVSPFYNDRLAPAVAYPLNASNGFLVTILEWVARTASAAPFAAVTTPGITPPLVGLFYLGCLPAALCEPALPEGRWPFWAAVLLLWTALWLALVGVGDL